MMSLPSFPALRDLAADPVYYEHRIPKRDGTERVVLEPEPRLKAVQQQLLVFFEQTLRVHPAATGRKGPIYNAAQHVGAKALMCFDVENFFGSITTQTIVARLTGTLTEPAARIAADLCTYQGTLPPGAPTSPILADAVCFWIDTELALRYGRATNCTYTRFVDDVTISFSLLDHADLRGLERLIAFRVAEEFGRRGLRLRDDKYQLLTSAEPMIVTGLLINPAPGRPPVRAPRSFWRSLRYDVKKLEEAVLQGVPLGDKHLQRVAGRAAFAGQTDAERAEPYKQRIKTLFRMRRCL